MAREAISITGWPGQRCCSAWANAAACMVRGLEGRMMARSVGIRRVMKRLLGEQALVTGDETGSDGGDAGGRARSIPALANSAE